MIRSMSSILVTGASGFIGAAAVRALASRGHRVHAAYASHPERVPTDVPNVLPVGFDLADATLAERLLREMKPQAVVHLGAMSELIACEAEPECASKINIAGTQAIVDACRAVDAVFVFASTDQVFDGEDGAYLESDTPRPLHVYGKTKLQAEEAVHQLGAKGLALRLSLVYGTSPTGSRSASEQIVAALERGDSPRLFTDEFRTPILVNDVSDVLCEMVMRMLAGDGILAHGAPRVLHVGGPARMSRHAFGTWVATAFGFDPGLLCAARQADVESLAQRPRDVSLDSSLARHVLSTPMRSVRDGLALLAADRASTEA